MGWEEPALGQDLQPGLSHQHLSGAGSDPTSGVLGSPGVRILGDKVSVLPRGTQEHPPSPCSVLEAAAFQDFVLHVYGVSVYSWF